MKNIQKHLRLSVLCILGIATLMIWYAVFRIDTRGDLLITFFDVGQGDAIFIETPSGNQMLIDGGPNERILARLGEALPFWDHSLDAVILTHPDADHLSGLIDVLERYHVGTVFWTGVAHSSAEYEEWVRLLKEKNIRTEIVNAGKRVILGDGVVFEVLAPFNDVSGESSSEINETSVVGVLRHGENTFLLTGDAGKRTESRLLFESLARIFDVDVLKVGHHGSNTSTHEEFLKIVSPEHAIIQVGKKNRYRHPSQGVLDGLAAAGAMVHRTDTDGDIRIRSNGHMYEVFE